MLVGAYDLHLYCESPDDGVPYRAPGHHSAPGEFVGNNFGDTLKQARAAGWLVRRNHDRTWYVLCPIHNAKGSRHG